MTTTPKPKEVKENRRLKSLDAKARSILYCGMTATEYNRISSYNTAKEICERLEVTYEGTSEVKDTRIRLLEQRHHNFKMIHGESMNSLFHVLQILQTSLNRLELRFQIKAKSPRSSLH